MLYSDFVKCANHFLNISNLTNDGWTLEYHKDHIYLNKLVTQCIQSKPEEKTCELNQFDENLIFEEDSQSINVHSIKFRKWQYNILYNFSYQVPVIYFNAWNSNGQLLALDELYEAVNPNFKEYVLGNKWYTLTQHEHPYLYKPFFYFHPCHTKDFLDNIADPKYNVLITWLSSIGQVIWLELNSTYGKMCSF